MPRRAEHLHDLPAPRRAIGDAPDLKPVTGTYRPRVSRCSRSSVHAAASAGLGSLTVSMLSWLPTSPRRRGLSTPRGSGTRLALQMLLVPYRSVIGERSRLCNQLQVLHVSAPGALRDRIGPARNGAKLAERLTGMRTRPTASLQENTTLQVLRDIASRTRALETQAQSYTREIEELVRSLAPTLLDEPGVGPICAGKLLAFNPARFTSEAAFARANGTAPQPASSGKTIRHRLSRGGDRQINAAIYTIALSRSVHHAASRTYRL
jgi:transposase